MLGSAGPGLVIAKVNKHPVSAEGELVTVNYIIRLVLVCGESLISPDEHYVRGKETNNMLHIRIIDPDDLHQQRRNTAVPQLNIAGYLATNPDDGLI